MSEQQISTVPVHTPKMHLLSSSLRDSRNFARCRFASDAPQQKILGCVTDTFGAVSLGAALVTFERSCYSSMSRDVFSDPIERRNYSYDWKMGPGYLWYWIFCFSGGVIRAVVHWLTPLPGMGVGAFTFKLPKQVRKCESRSQGSASEFDKNLMPSTLASLTAGLRVCCKGHYCCAHEDRTSDRRGRQKGRQRWSRCH